MFSALKARVSTLLKGEKQTEITGTASGNKFALDTNLVNSSLTTSVSNLNTDAFARLRVSNLQTLFDSKQISDNHNLFWDDQETSGSSTSSTFSQAKARHRLTVASGVAGTRVRQTFQRFNYQPGKSQLVVMTGVIGCPEKGITRRIGYFDENNGIFLESGPNDMAITLRTATSGSPDDTRRIRQRDWNLDTMDGNGSSGIDLDFCKTQIFFMDIEWLGVGRVRYGFFIDGVPYYCHQFLNTNILEEVYMSTPNLPVRYEISNDGTGASADLDHICCSVASEGGEQDTGSLRFISTEGTHIDADTADTLYACIGIRLKSGNLDTNIKLVRASMLNDTADDFEFVLMFNPTVAGTFTYNDVANSAAQIAIGATANTVTGGTAIDGGLVRASNNSGSVVTDLNNAIRLGSAIDGTPDEIVLCVRPYSANADINASISWREL